ncbi:MAG: signal recognition particle receptor subunit alpha [Infirmifilum sp.]
MESLRTSLLGVVEKIKNSVLLDTKEVDTIIRDLQRVLLKADVDVKLVFDLSERIKKKFFSQEIPPGFSKRELLIKILYDELVSLLGGEASKEFTIPKTPYKIMLVGIEGSGKTTTAAKLAKYLKESGYRVGLIAADTYRPGAHEQLKQLAALIDVDFYGNPGLKDPIRLVEEGIRSLQEKKVQVFIIDTAGRHKDEEALMREVSEIYEKLKPDDVILVVDATLGKEVARQAKAFHERVPLGHVIVTKLDGSARGGGALSAVASTGASIVFVGTGEKLENLEAFVPQRFVARLLGMPDLDALLKRFQAFEETEKERARLIASGKITLLDLKEQLLEVRKMGPLSKVLEMFGGSPIPIKGSVENSERKVDRWIAIMNSMTAEELLKPEIIDRSRMMRIARGSGTTVRDVKKLLEAHAQMKKLMRQLYRSRRRVPGLSF